MSKGRLEAFGDGVLAIVIFVLVPILWVIPDRSIERSLNAPEG